MTSMPPPEAEVPDWIHADTVDALLETVRSLLRDEDSREQSVTGRAVGLSGFSGLIVSVVGPLSAASSTTSQLSAPWRIAVLLLVAGALLAFLTTIAIAVLGVLRPKEFSTLAMTEIERYPLPEFVGQPRVMVQGRILRGLVDSLATERLKNTAKATWLGRAYYSLLTGLVLVVAIAVILVSHTAGLI